MADMFGGNTLTDPEYRRFLELLRTDRNRNENAVNLPSFEHEEKGSDVFIVIGPAASDAGAGGIQAMSSEWTPGYGFVGSGSVQVFKPQGAVCDVWRVTLRDADATAVLEPAFIDQLVYNLGADPLPAGAWAIAHRERFGAWVVTDVLGGGLDDEFGTGTGTGTGTGHFAYLEYKTDCIDGRNVRFKRTVCVAANVLSSFVTDWIFDSYQGQCDFESTGTGTSTGHFSYFDYRTDCEHGVNVRYRRLVTVTDPLVASHTGAWVFDSFQGSCDFPGTGTGTILDCDPVTLYEQEVRCESGYLNVYRRAVVLDIVEGCLQQTVGAFSFYQQEGYCNGVQIVNTDNIHNVPCRQGVVLFNRWDSTLNICFNYVWYTYCHCYGGATGTATWYDTGTGTGTGSDTGGGGGGSTIQTSCFARAVPTTLHATFSGGGGTCVCVNSIPSKAINNSGVFTTTPSWTATFVDTFCGSGGTVTLTLTCNTPFPSTWALTATSAVGNLQFPATTPVSASWDGVTMSIVFNVSIIAPCNGSFTVTITL